MITSRRTKLSNHEVWRLQYRQRRYLRDASEDTLAQRLKDVMNNLSILTPEGKIGPLPVDTDGIYWMTLLTHIHEEYVFRNAYPPVLSEMPFPEPTASDVPKAVSALADIEVPRPGHALIKFGKRGYMQQLYESGRIRVAPASSYLDSSLNHAIADDELRLDQFMAKQEVTFTYSDKTTGELKNSKPASDVTVTTNLSTDFYMYCMACTTDIRLFDDFEADACVIVLEPTAFATRLYAAVRRELPDWTGQHQRVDYVDPYLSSRDNINLFFSKHFRYWYQQEYRFAWIPHPEKGGCDSLQPIFIELGPLKKISELVLL